MENCKKWQYLICLLLGITFAHFINFIAVETICFLDPSIPQYLLWNAFYLMGLAIFMSLSFALFFIYLFNPPNTNKPTLPCDDDLPFISVVIPAYNEEKNIAKAIESVLYNGYPQNKLEVMVVDDGSKDRTAEVVSKYPVNLVRNERNRGRGFSVYRGIQKAKGDIVVMVDADTYLLKGSLRHLCAAFQDSKICAVCGFLIPHKSSSFLGRQQKVEYLLGFAYNKHIRASTGWMLIPSGAFSAYRRSLVKHANIVDTIAEDFDLGLYVHEKGSDLTYAPRAQAITKIPLTFKGYFRQRVRWSLGGLQVLAKHSSLMMNRKKPAVGLFGLPYHYIMGYAIPPLELLGTAVLFLLPIISGLSWSDVIFLFLWFIMIKLYSMIVIIPARRYAQKIANTKIPVLHLFEYWFAYYYFLLITTIAGLVKYMRKGQGEW